MQKLHCYVDETGQDTKGKIFIVAVVVTDEERDKLLDLCGQLEKISGKRKSKWGRAKHRWRMRYLGHVFADDRFKNSLRYRVFRRTSDFDTATIKAIAQAATWKRPRGKYTTLIYVDGLTKTKRREYGARLRQLGLRVRQVRGVTREENNTLIRLADAIAGFVRDVLENEKREMKALFEKAKREGTLIEVKPSKNHPLRGGRA